MNTVASEQCGSGGSVLNNFFPFLNCRGFLRQFITSEERNSIISNLSRRFPSQTSRSSTNTNFEHDLTRNLQIANCDFFYILKIAIIFDKTFCDDNGGEEQSKDIIEELISEVTRVFESTICLTFEINLLEGYCNDSNPYSNLKEVTDAIERLGDFKVAFDANSGLIPGEGLAYLFSGRDAPLSNQDTGAAYPRALCKLPERGYGLAVFSGITKVNCKQALTLLLHEIGHNVGGFGTHPHGGPADLITTKPFCNGCTEFQPIEIADLRNGLFRGDKLPDQEIPCIRETTATTPPTPSPTPFQPLRPPPPPPPPPLPPISSPPTTLAPVAPPVSTQQPTSRPTSVRAPLTSFPTPAITTAADTGQFPIALPSALGSGALGAALWYGRRRFLKK